MGLPSRNRSHVQSLLMLDNSCLSESTIRELYEVDGLSAQEIARQLDSKASAVRRIMRHAGIKARSRSEAMRLRRAKQIERLVLIPEHELRHLYQDIGLTTCEIAEVYECCSGTVNNRLRQFGIPLSLPGRVRVSVSRQELENLYHKQGLSLRQVSALVGCDHSTIHKKLTEHGLLLSGLFQPYGHVQIGKPNRKGCRNITCYLNSTFSFLTPKVDEVPDWIRSNNSCSLAFAAGYIDAEGSFYVTGAAGRFTISSYDRNIIHWLHDWFIEIGIECRPPNIAGHAGALRPKW